MVAWSAAVALLAFGCSSPDTCLLQLIMQVLRCVYPGCMG
jgi:hypothetical protein